MRTEKQKAYQKAYMKIWRAENKERAKKKHLEWLSKNRERVRRVHNEYRKTENYKKCRQKTQLQRQRAYYAKYPDKIQARILLGEELKKKKIIKSSCEVCREVKHIQGHHEDYSKPLNVMWLCQWHHSQLHYSEKEYNRLLGEIKK